MNVDKNMTTIICDIEHIIGNKTYNPNSYNGWTCEEGCSFRYPVNYCKDKKALEEESLIRTKYIIEDIEPECVNTMKYKFGSNHLYVGSGIVKTLEFLEKRYNLDFNALEAQKRLNVKEKLNVGDSVNIVSGKWIVGEDIPAGTYIITKNEKINIFSAVDIMDEVGATRPVYLFNTENEVNLCEGQTLIIREECTLRKK